MATASELREKYGDTWWTAPKGIETAKAVQAAGRRREWAQMPIRFRNLAFFRLMTGRPALATWNYSLARRPEAMASYYGQFEFPNVKTGGAALRADVYVNRLLGHLTYIEFMSQASDWNTRSDAEARQMYVEAAMKSLDYFGARTTMGTEGIWYGTGVLWFGDDGFGNPSIEAVNPDELLYSNPDEVNPGEVIRRRWDRRSRLISATEDKELQEAIAKAPEIHPGFYFGTDPLDCSDIIATFEAVIEPMGNDPGRRVRVIGDHCIVDEKWEDPLPRVTWQFQPMPGSQMGQGLSEQLIDMSAFVDELMNKAHDADMRCGTKWFYDENSNVNPDALGGTNDALVSYSKVRPEHETPEPIGRYFIEHVKFLNDLMDRRAHVSEIGVSGQPPPGVDAAVAIQALSNIEATVFLEKINRLERVDRQSAYQLLLLGKRLRLKFALPGQKKNAIDWKTLKVPSEFDINEIQAFNIGRLSQEIPGQIQKLTEMFDRGVLDKKRFLRFLPFPDMMGLYRTLNAGADDVQKSLDELVKSDSFIPPSPYLDFEYAKEEVESRYDREEADGADQAVLDRLSMWRSQLLELKAQNETPDSPEGFTGVQLPEDTPAGAGGAPAVQPQQAALAPAEGMPQ